MTQKEYLKKLQHALWLHVSKEDRQEILSDYQEYFSEGIAVGEKEEQISIRLGQPKMAAKALIAEKRNSFSKRRWLLIFVSGLLPLFALWSTSWSLHFYVGSGRIWVCPYFIFLLGIISFFVRSFPWKRKEQASTRIYLIVTVCVSAILIFGVAAVAIGVGFGLHGQIFIDPQAFQTAVDWLRWIVPICILGMWLWLLWVPRNDTPARQAMNLWFSGLLGFVAYGNYTLNELSELEYLSTFAFWGNWLWPLVIGFISTAVCMLVFNWVEKRGNIA